MYTIEIIQWEFTDIVKVNNWENTCSWKISKDIKIQDIVRALQTITK